MGLDVLCVYIGHNPGTRHPLTSALEIPYGFALIATMLKNGGHATDLLALAPNDVLSGSFLHTISGYDPQLICFSCISSHFPLVREVAQAFKSLNPKKFIAIGGAHATLNPQSVIDCPEIDAVCVGEGEHGICKLAGQLNAGGHPDSVANFWLKDGETGLVQRNPTSPFTNDLDKLPFIDREMWKPWIENPSFQPAVLIGRGCPNNCSFCCNHKFKKVANGKYLRFRSASNIVEEIGQLVQVNNTDYVYLETETLSSNLGFAFQLCDALKNFNEKRPYHVKFGINFSLTDRIARDPQLANELLSKLVEANVMHLNIGLESGSELLRQQFRRPRYTNEDFIAFCHLARQYGLSVRTYVMIGLPGETLSQWKETIHVVKKAAPNDVALSIFFPYPGTEAYEMAVHSHSLKMDISKYVEERQQVVVESPGFPARRISLEFRLFERKVLCPQGSWKTKWNHKILAQLMAIPPLGYFMVYLIDTLKDRFPGVRRNLSRWFSYSY